MSIILSSAYNAPIQYYTKFLLGQSIIIEQHDSYLKQSYRNRCVICSADSPMTLSVPIANSSTDRAIMKNMEISEHGNWQHKHWNALVSSYNSSPFFDYYRDEYEQFYNQKHTSLVHFNDQLLRLTLSNLNIDAPTICYSEEYFWELSADDIDCRELIHPKRLYSGDELFVPKEYYQLFTHRYGFTPNASILDLLFNMGNESLLVLLASIAR